MLEQLAASGPSAKGVQHELDIAYYRTGKLLSAELRIPLPAVEVGIAHGLPEAGARKLQMKVLDQQASPHSLRLRLAAPANRHQTLFLRVNDSKVHLRIDGADASVDSAQLKVQFPPGAGYVEKTATISW